jgi:hypothetical protein
VILFWRRWHGEAPMWTTKNRGRYDRSKLRYPSDLTDEEWSVIEPMIPPARRGGGKRSERDKRLVHFRTPRKHVAGECACVRSAPPERCG